MLELLKSKLKIIRAKNEATKSYKSEDQLLEQAIDLIITQELSV